VPRRMISKQSGLLWKQSRISSPTSSSASSGGLLKSWACHNPSLLPFTKCSRLLSLGIYLLMGWLAILAVVPLIAAMTYKGFAWLTAGGLLYTGGIYFYVASKKGMRHGHGIWHLFVLGGSACHYLAVLFFVA